jgi:predicted RNA binding protein YcfA (HicA-like mRNA interferase family)
MAINQGQAPSRCAVAASSLSDLKNRSVVGLAGKPHSGCSQNSAGRGQILTISPGNSRSIAQESGEIWTGQADLQPIYFKSDRLLGWQLKRQTGSHKTLTRAGWSDFVFAFHDGDEIGPKMLARIAKHTGLSPNDL